MANWRRFLAVLMGRALGRACAGWIGLLFVSINSTCTDPREAAGTAAASCSVARAAAVRLRVVEDRLFADGAINDVPVTLLIDRGSDLTLLTEAARARLRLDVGASHEPPVELRDVAGVIKVPRLTVDRFALSDATIGETRFVVVPDMKIMHQALSPDGIVGEDFLSQYDIDLDVPARQMTLYRVSNCHAKFLPWSFSYDALPARWSPTLFQLDFPVRLNGAPLRAVFDSGAPGTLVFLDTALNRLGITQNQLDRDRKAELFGVSGVSTVAYLHTFDSGALGSQKWQSPALLVGGRAISCVDVVIGLSYLIRHRVWISPSTTQVFIRSSG
jgi:predicted aspartyl protease